MLPTLSKLPAPDLAAARVAERLHDDRPRVRLGLRGLQEHRQARAPMLRDLPPGGPDNPFDGLLKARRKISDTFWTKKTCLIEWLCDCIE